ncbi:MAG: universal stress protein [Flavobacteriales bacterium]|nr:universal stress protein [Flavobacteriales bacterium]
MKNIVAAVDFSPITQRVMRMAMDTAKGLNAKVWVIHAAAPDPDFVGFKTGPQYIRDHRAQELREEHAQLHGMADEFRHAGVDCDALLVQGPTAETIVAEAHRLNADLIIMGSHGHGALFRALLGSVSEQVLRESETPLLIIPSPK